MKNGNIQDLLRALQWLLLRQNRDGSWGKSQIDKIRWTANASIALCALGFDSTTLPALSSAVRWLKNLPRTGEWYLRTPALIAAGEARWLESEGDLRELESQISSGGIPSLYHRAALAIELLHYGHRLRAVDAIRSEILTTQRSRGTNLVSLTSSTNDTSLFATLLMTLGNADDSATVQAAIAWVQTRLIENPGSGSVCWENSYSKTAYIALNLLDLRARIPIEETLLPQIFSFFAPLDTGAIPADTTPAHDSTDSTYTTILYLRLAGELYSQYPEFRQASLAYLLGKSVSYSLATRLRHSKVIRRWILPLAVAGVVSLPVFWLVDSTFVEGVSSSVVASVVVAIFVAMRKLIEKERF